MIRFVFASHGRMAEGLRDTIAFLTSTEEGLYSISAYTTPDYDIQKEVDALFTSFDKDDTVIIMTDIMQGSVNQKFYPYLGEKVHLISGINVPAAMTLVLMREDAVGRQDILQVIKDAKNTLVYVNDWTTETGEDDE